MPSYYTGSPVDLKLLVPFQPKTTSACAAAENHNQITLSVIFLASGQLA